MPKFFMLGIALFLLLAAAGYGLTTLQARSIPWDCSDWQAFAHADRTTSILESLAENRGKTLYCGVDQSDTFSKAETWEAGKDRNERDDTVYFGERGQFRGFIAAQEGWLTEGESGVTGVSIDRIFEFPREERRVKRVKRFDIANDAEQFPINAAASCGQVGGLICSDWGDLADSATSAVGAQLYARNRQLGNSPDNSEYPSDADRYDWQTHRADEWQTLADTVVGAACRKRGARLVSVVIGRGHDEADGNANWNSGDNLGWFFSENQYSGQGTGYQYEARQSRTWTATCKKTIRRTRR